MEECLYFGALGNVLGIVKIFIWVHQSPLYGINNWAFWKGQWISKAIYGLLNSSKKQTKLTILNIFSTQNSEFRSFYGRIENTIICFLNLLTFNIFVSPHGTSLSNVHIKIQGLLYLTRKAMLLSESCLILLHHL